MSTSETGKMEEKPWPSDHQLQSTWAREKNDHYWRETKGIIIVSVKSRDRAIIPLKGQSSKSGRPESMWSDASWSSGWMQQFDRRKAKWLEPMCGARNGEEKVELKLCFPSLMYHESSSDFLTSSYRPLSCWILYSGNVLLQLLWTKRSSVHILPWFSLQVYLKQTYSLQHLYLVVALQLDGSKIAH